MDPIVSTFLGILIGGVVTWFASQYFYAKASKDLTAEANELRQLTVLLLRGMEAAGWVKYNRDPEGKPIGIIFEETGTATVHLSGSLTNTVIRGSNEQKPAGQELEKPQQEQPFL